MVNILVSFCVSNMSQNVSQVAGNLLRDSAECDSLADQILNTAFARYVGANDISNATDTNEVQCAWLCELNCTQMLFDVRVLYCGLLSHWQRFATRVDAACFITIVVP